MKLIKLTLLLALLNHDNVSFAQIAVTCPKGKTLVLSLTGMYQGQMVSWCPFYPANGVCCIECKCDDNIS